MIKGITKEPASVEAKDIARILAVLEEASLETARQGPRSFLPHELIPIYQLAALERIARGVETLGTYQAASGMLGLIEQMTGGKLVDAIKRGAKDPAAAPKKGSAP